MHKTVNQRLKKYMPVNILRMATLFRSFVLKNNKKDGLAFYHPKQNNRLLVLGNGPSLNGTIDSNFEKLQHYDLMVVNQFAISDYFEMLRPQYYVLADPVYYAKNDGFRRELSQLISAIKAKTKWELTIFLSEEAKESKLVNSLKNFTNIKFVFYSGNRIHYEWFENKKLFKLLNKDMIEPPAQTVINTALSIGIYYKYKKIYIIGADTSWHEEYIIDQDTNDMYIESKHFYGNRKKLYKRHTKNTSNMGEEFFSISKVFFFYHFLQEYAMNNQSKIYNSSEFSWIDVFDRRDLE